MAATHEKPFNTEGTEDAEDTEVFGVFLAGENLSWAALIFVVGTAVTQDAEERQDAEDTEESLLAPCT